MAETKRWRKQRPCQDCGQPCGGKRCRPCYFRTLPPAQGRPGYSHSERRRRKAVVDAHIAEHGWWCPGWNRPPHAVEPGPRAMSADHVVPYAVSGDEGSELQAMCTPCNSRKRDSVPRGIGAGTPQRPAVRPAQPRTGPVAPPGKPASVREAYDMPTDPSARRLAAVEPAPEPEPRTTPDPPAGIGDGGRRVWDDVTAEYDLEEHELALLAQYVRTVDICDRLQEIVDRDGPLVPVLPAGEKTHPALVELRQQRIALARLGATLRLPAGDQDDADAVKRPQRRGGARGVYGIRGAV